MKHTIKPWALIIAGILLLAGNLQSAPADSLEAVFLNPSMAARPYVWWHWMGPNFSQDGITKDLEAMKAAGIGGATIFNLPSGVRESEAPIGNNPWPQQTYRSPAYWAAIKHAAAEAQRLGLEIGLHNTVGYSATGGPWINQERNMQRVVWSETAAEGGKKLSLSLAQPSLPPRTRYGTTYSEPLTFYRDIAVLAVPAAGELTPASVIDLSSKLKPDGALEWDAPPGGWKIYRYGHGPTGSAPAPVPDDVIGHTLEADKMSAEQTRFHWSQVLDPLREHVGPYFGRGFGHLLIDSYEAGNQDWTPGFREEFIKRKGYDPVPWLITRAPGPKDANGKTSSRKIGSAEQTARFNYDFKEVVAELFRVNGWEIGAAMIRHEGLTLQWEAYGGPFDTVAGSALADLPMGEFWTHGNGMIGGNIVGAARAAGRRVIAAEAFTGQPQVSHWDETPAKLKYSADGFYGSGGNRLVLHHWVHQPFDERYQPGTGMGWWGTHFNRNQTWFEPGKEFIAYLSRSQALLQRGEPTVDVVSVGQPVNGSDVIPLEVFLSGVKVNDGQVVLPSGRRYRVLVVPHKGELTPEMTQRIGELLAAGANIVATRPDHSPSLKHYPACDATVRALAEKIWGAGPAATKPVGKGKLYGQGDVNVALQDLGLAPLWTLTGGETKDVRVTQRRDDSAHADIFFVANTGAKAANLTLSCRVAGRLPELWNAEDGTRQPAANWRVKAGRTEVDLALGARDAIFVVFRQPTTLTHATAPAPAVIAASPVEGAWEVSFAPGMGAPEQIEFPALVSWSEHTNAAIQYFSGTATYRRTVKVDPQWLGAGKKLQLDLGDVRDLATVRLNGKNVRVLWRAPYVLDLTAAAQPGDNLLEIAVCNTWHNRLIGDEQEPEDITWGEIKSLGKNVAGRPLVAYPDWFVKNQPRPSAGRKAFVNWNYFTKDSPLIPAGLLGPVNLRVE